MSLGRQASICNYCEDTDGRKAELFCMECSSQLCVTCCDELHSRGKWKAHRIKPLEEAGPVKKQRLCTEHRGETISHVCITCNAMCCAHCFVDGKHAGHQWKLLGAYTEEVQKRVDKKTKHCSQMCQQAEQNLRTIADKHDELNRAAETLKLEIEGGISNLTGILDEREEAMLAATSELEDSKTRVLQEMTDELNNNKASLQQGIDAAQKAIAEQDKYDFIMNSPELENWLDSLVEMDLTVKVSAVGVTLNRLVHWESVHRVIEMLDLNDSGDRGIRGDEVADSRAESLVSRGPPSAVTSAVRPTSATRGLSGSDLVSPSSPASRAMPPGSPADTVPNAIYVNGLPNDCTEADLREVFGQFGDIKMVNARHVATGGFSFVFFRNEQGALAALENPRVTIKGKVANVLAKKQILGSGGR